MSKEGEACKACCTDLAQDLNPMNWGEPKFLQATNKSYLAKITVGDINSFFMLFFDNFSSLLAILAEMIFIPLIVLNFQPPGNAVTALGRYAASPPGCGNNPWDTVPCQNETMTVADYLAANEEVVWLKICPGIAIALLVGNFWYAWMAAKLAGKEERMDVTALPYGINTPAGFLTVFMIQLPIMFFYQPAYNEISPMDWAERSWKGACAANFIGGCFEVLGIAIGPSVRRNVPRAAFFAPVCGVGFVWLGFNPLIDVMREPLIGFIPLFFCFTGFFAAKGAGIYSSKIPMALVIMVIGTVLWWAGLSRHDTEKRELNDLDVMGELAEDRWEKFAGKNEMNAFVTLGFEYMKSNGPAVVFPIALASFIETIENVEMAALCGDNYNVKEAMLADGLGTCIGAMFGSTIPTTVYIGHIRHKKAGAKWFYSVLNALVFFVFMMSGMMAWLFYVIDQTSVGVILIAVGLMIVQAAMESSAPRHYPCLMIGIMFLVADMLYFDHFDATVRVATRSAGRMKGVMNMAPGGGIMCSLIVTALLCDLIDARFARASVWALFGCIFSFFGLMHGANYVYSNGMATSAMGADEADFYTTDLGELMWGENGADQDGNGGKLHFGALHVKATHLNFQYWKPGTYDPGFVAPGEEGAALVGDYDLSYKVQGAATFRSPYECLPWVTDPNNFVAPGNMMCRAFTAPTADNGGLQRAGYNEGWRFAIAYLVVFVLCLLHAFIGPMVGMIPATMDNGVGKESLIDPDDVATSTASKSAAVSEA